MKKAIAAAVIVLFTSLSFSAAAPATNNIYAIVKVSDSSVVNFLWAENEADALSLFLWPKVHVSSTSTDKNRTDINKFGLTMRRPEDVKVLVAANYEAHNTRLRRVPSLPSKFIDPNDPTTLTVTHKWMWRDGALVMEERND